MLRINNIKINVLEQNIEEAIHKKVCKILKINPKQLSKKDIIITKKSIDARIKSEIFYVFAINVKIPSEIKYLNQTNITKVENHKYITPKKASKKYRPIVIGTGPAGLFCGLILAKAGLNPILVERGKTAIERKNDVEMFWQSATLNENSNVQFGEGGAGTFSDGKLTTSTKDIRIQTILEELVDCGAPSEILINQKPHIGTDNLMKVIPNLRKKIITFGGEFKFSHKLTDIFYEDSQLKSIELTDLNNNDKLILQTNDLVLALGHSARDTFKLLYERGITLAPKPFAIGLRIEHSQDFINKSQYGNFFNLLPPADYSLTTKTDAGRSVYTFCMCPGGVVVPASSEKEHLVINGMSYYSRNLNSANSAILVNVTPKDFGTDPLDGIAFAKKLESAAYNLSKDYKAPAQNTTDFLKNVPSASFYDIMPSYALGVTKANINDILPPFIQKALHQGLIMMDKKINGFVNNSVLTAIESRSSSPVKIIRDPITFCSNIKGVIPCGEGAGYAGGIMSAAVDGIKCAEAILLL